MAIDERLQKLITSGSTEFVFPENLVRLRGCVNYAERKQIIFPERTKLLNLGHAFNRYNGYGVEELHIPANIYSLNNEDFEENTNLKKVYFPSTLRHIDGSAFKDCNNLEEIHFENGIKTLEGGCFMIGIGYDSGKLTYVEIPSSITQIDSNVFNGRNRLETIRIHKKLNSISGAPWGATNATVIWDCGTVNLNLTTGSTLFIDGEQVTTNPCYVDEGTHTWECYHPNYPMKTGNFEIAIDETYNLTVDMTDGIGYTITCGSTQEFEDEVVKYLYGNYTYIGKTIVVAPNTALRVVLSKSGYKRITRDIIVTEDLNLTYEMEEAVQETIDFKYPFDMNYDSVTFDNFIDGYNFIVNGNYIQSHTASYGLDNGRSFGYINFTTPGLETTLKVKCYTYSETNCDFGAIYCGTNLYNANINQIRNGTTDSNGNWLYRSIVNNPGSMIPSEYSTILQPNTEYYLQFYYVKDGSVNEGADRIYIESIEFEALPK